MFIMCMTVCFQIHIFKIHLEGGSHRVNSGEGVNCFNAVNVNSQSVVVYTRSELLHLLLCLLLS